MALSYISTRGQGQVLDFGQVLLTGLASDGGLYVPSSWPSLETSQLVAWRGRPYAEIAAEVMTAFGAPDIHSLTAQAYDKFAHHAVAPLRQLTSRLWLLELFHGPSWSFKDIALQLLGLLFERYQQEQSKPLLLLGATSGDTGSAAIEAFKGRKGLNLVMLHPQNRISEVQRLQMTTVAEPNIHNLAIQGTFDDCQRLVKALLGNHNLHQSCRLAAVNSINWARISAQTAYYISAAVALGAPEREMTFAVPTGNFGNIYAAHTARAMGLPIGRLIVGTNRNDTLTRFIDTGSLQAREVIATLSPSMDIQVPSNLERWLFELYQRDGQVLSELMQRLRHPNSSLTLSEHQRQQTQALFWAHAVNDQQTRATIQYIYQQSGVIIDPHTAVGVRAAQIAVQQAAIPPHIPIVVLGCAHPAKFPDAVASAIGIRPDLPARSRQLGQLDERYHILPNNPNLLTDFIHQLAAS